MCSSAAKGPQGLPPRPLPSRLPSPRLNAAARVLRHTGPPPPGAPSRTPPNPPSGAIVIWHLDLGPCVRLGLVWLPEPWGPLPHPGPAGEAAAGRGAAGWGWGAILLGPQA